jgi:hypothetical protein
MGGPSTLFLIFHAFDEIDGGLQNAFVVLISDGLQSFVEHAFDEIDGGLQNAFVVLK